MRVLKISLEASMAASLPEDEDDEPCAARTRPSLVCCRRGRCRLLRGVLFDDSGFDQRDSISLLFYQLVQLPLHYLKNGSVGLNYGTQKT